ncbi:hypothetical protein [Phaeodactylibacter sp.]|uniref:hypothetical protein n=1 Tax=Phaeodactylibacter sp. TaxID=1940289 RepID=UPI0025E47EEB|nr:hypothetical protein [Phaeodactylibacter sp.]MCI4650801.1 hypothetical protein [Phaeodactylibacter sp.]MCI5089758.1 hypothetical protein [Phaeodactylibacter sp.]
MHLFKCSLLLLLSTLCTLSSWAQNDDLENLFADFEEEEEEVSPYVIKGFLDARFGPRIAQSKENSWYTLGEARAQFDYKYATNNLELALVTDLKYSPLQTDPFEDVENGVGILDIREFSFSKSIGTSFELKAGRQILTWGTGDMLFINDLFPKDWQSFFSGRQVNYLKAPSNSVKLSNFNKWFTLDLVWTPRFTSDRFINGSNIEYFNPFIGGIVGESAMIQPSERDEYFSESEFAIRVHKVIKGVELDLYGYDGFWKTPEGFNDQGQFFFPQLSVIGASLRTPLFTGVFNVEYGHYFSRDHENNRLKPIRNSEDRLLVGFEKEVVKNFTASTQLYIERINDFDRYLENFEGFAFRDEVRTMLTLRLEYFALEQRLRFSFFNYYSPNEKDFFSKNTITFKYRDNLQFELGSNYFTGKNDFSFWGQFQTTSNIYAGLTWYY